MWTPCTFFYILPRISGVATAGCVSIIYSCVTMWLPVGKLLPKKQWLFPECPKLVQLAAISLWKVWVDICWQGQVDYQNAIYYRKVVRVYYGMEADTFNRRMDNLSPILWWPPKRMAEDGNLVVVFLQHWWQIGHKKSSSVSQSWEGKWNGHKVYSPYFSAIPSAWNEPPEAEDDSSWMHSQHAR